MFSVVFAILAAQATVLLAGLFLSGVIPNGALLTRGI